MRKLILDILVVNLVLSVAILAVASSSNAVYVITEIIDVTGDQAGNPLVGADGVAVDSSGNVYVVGAGDNLFYPSNVFKITLGGTITEIIDATGNGSGNTLDGAQDVAVDSSGNVYVTGFYSDNTFKIATPGTCSTTGIPCTITEIIDSTGDADGNTLDLVEDVAVDSSGNVYVTGYRSANAFKIATPGTCSTTGIPCTITEIIDSAGDASGNSLDLVEDVAVDSSGNVFVAGRGSDNAFKVATPGTCSTTGTPCTITQIIDSTGDGGGRALNSPDAVAVDSSSNVYVAGTISDNAFRIATPGTCSTTGIPCTITEIIDSTGDGSGNTLDNPLGVAVDSSGNLYVAGAASDNAFKIATPGTCSTTGTACTITQIIDSTGDGAGNTLDIPLKVAVDSSSSVYVTGYFSDNTFKIEQMASQVPVLSNRGLAVLGASLLCIVLWVARRQRMAKA